MRIVWDEQTVRWFHNASAYTGYDKKLAEFLLPYLPCRDTLCDIGCGAGLIDLELAPYIGQITCVDISPQAIDSLEARIRQHGLENISALCASADTLEGQWDTVMALFFGEYRHLTDYLSLAKDRLILAVHEEARGNFGPAGRKADKCSNVKSVQAFLENQGIRYQLVRTELEYGQPFADRAEAETFVKAYSTPMPQEELDAYLAKNLVRTGREDFPFYLPKRKKFGLFLIQRAENKKFLE